MSKRKAIRSNSETVMLVAAPPSPRKKQIDKFGPAALDDLWDRWLQGALFPVLLGLLALRMAVVGYAVLPSLRITRWMVFHGLDARLLALSVVGLALVCHVRARWPLHDRLAPHVDLAQIAAWGLVAFGPIGLLLHQGYLLFQ